MKQYVILIIALALSFSLASCKGKISEKDILKEQEEISTLLSKGKITPQEAEKRFTELNIKFQELRNGMVVESIPQWAINCGLSNPKGLLLDKGRSKITSAANPSDKLDSIEFVYKGEWETLKSEAKRLATEAKLAPMVKDGESLSDKLGIVTYTNNLDKAPEYIISVTADRDANELTIQASNVKQMQEIMKNYIKK